MITSKILKQEIMNKKRTFWLIVAIVVVALIVFVKVVPVWASLVGSVSLACGVITGWRGKMFYDKHVK